MSTPAIIMRNQWLVPFSSAHQPTWDLKNRSAGVIVCSLIHQITCRSSVVQHHDWIPSNPYRDNRLVVLFCSILRTCTTVFLSVVGERFPQLEEAVGQAAF